MPALKLPRLLHRDETKPTLRERAAALKVSATRVIRRKPLVWPAPGSDEAKAMAAAARSTADRADQAARLGYPDLKRTDLEWWTKDTLWQALEAGDMPAAQVAPLYQMAAERELRIEAVAVRTKVGALQVLAFAGDYPAPANAVPEADPVLAAIEANRAAQADVEAFDEKARGGMTSALFAEEGRLTTIQSRTRNAVYATVPTTRAGQLALLRWINWQMDLYGMLDGSPPENDSAFWGDAHHCLVAALAADVPPRGVEEDPALLDIGRRWAQLQADYRDAGYRLGEIEQAHPEPARPRDLNVYQFDLLNGFPLTSSMGNKRMPYGRAQVEELRATPRMGTYIGGKAEGVRREDGSVIAINPPAQKRAEAIIAAWDQWQAEVAVREVESGTLKAREALQAADRAYYAAAQQARVIRAKTQAGVLIKAQIAADLIAWLDRDQEAAERGEDDEEAMLFSLLSDVLSVGGLPGYGISKAGA